MEAAQVTEVTALSLRLRGTKTESTVIASGAKKQFSLLPSLRAERSNQETNYELKMITTGKGVGNWQSKRARLDCFTLFAMTGHCLLLRLRGTKQENRHCDCEVRGRKNVIATAKQEAIQRRKEINGK